MKFNKIAILSVFGVVFATVQMIASQEGVASQDDINAQYQQYYQQLAQQHAQHHGNPGGIKNRQDFADDIESFLGPDASLIMGGAALALGLISIVVVNIQGTEYRSICKEAKALGNTALTLSSTSTIPATYTTSTHQGNIITQLNLIENAINNVPTPTCSS